jgi:hypothetical protein
MDIRTKYLPARSTSNYTHCTVYMISKIPTALLHTSNANILVRYIKSCLNTHYLFLS